MRSRGLALILFSALALAPLSARAAVPVAIYPLKVPGLSASQRTDLQNLLEAGLISAARRGVLQPRSPVGLPITCGDTPTSQCLASVSKDGLVLTGRGEVRGGVIVLSAALWDRNGAHTREVRFVVDLVIQNLRSVGEAIAEMEVEILPDGTVAGADKPRAAAPAAAGGAAVAGAAAAA